MALDKLGRPQNWNTEQRKIALDKYYANPNICLKCGEVIKITSRYTVYHTRKIKFCSARCANLFNSKATIEKRNKSLRNNINSVTDLHPRTISRIFCRVLNVGCCVCGWKEDRCDIHHIVPEKDGGTNDNNNLCYICPNCRRLAHSSKISSDKLIPITVYVPNWKDFYRGWNSSSGYKVGVEIKRSS